jgi:hypothetical protein
MKPIIVGEHEEKYKELCNDYTVLVGTVVGMLYIFFVWICTIEAF